MALVKWNPWAELESFKQNFDRFFDTYMLPGTFGGSHAQQAVWMPRMDVRETDTAYIVEADLPGLTIEDIDVQVEGTTLIISGERKGEQSSGPNGHYTHFERWLGKFHRSFTLPTAVKVDEVDAKYANGVLTVTVPKVEEARTKRIAIQAA